MKALITGASGFLGTALCKRLLAEGHEIAAPSSKDADLRLAGTLERFSGTRYDAIWHLAAWTQAGEFCLHHPGEQWVINQRIHTNVLDWWARDQPQALMVAMGTSCAYDPGLPLVEENYLKGEPIGSLFSYAMTKRMLLAGLVSMRKQYGLEYLHLVPSTLYGPNYHCGGRQPHFIFDLIGKILRGARNGDPVILWGDGHQRRELVYIDDFVSAALRLGTVARNETVNLGSGEDHSIREFAMMICEEVGYDFDRIRFDTSRYVGARSKMLDVEKKNKLAGPMEQTPLCEGLRNTIKWVCQNQTKEGLRKGGRG
ncbi:MAG: NAD-dependent epimerase/dehydratase family protein [Terrimicrobiaceae bacterium]|jgi:GDP-L-fucose synthase|nr:NAD-dependent epimerase/dehydratase family protein [Terrimicrobiaceae bacterium]